MDKEAMAKELQKIAIVDQQNTAMLHRLQHNFTPDSPARSLCASIVDHIRAFERTLDDDHETFVALASFGRDITMAVESVSYKEPNIIIFSGIVCGSRSELMQHINQLSFLLLAAKKACPDRPARRIGFATD